jgi:hypothetical protein
MTFCKQFWQALGVVALGALVSTTAIGQVTTRTVTAGGAATSTKIHPGDMASIDIRLDVGTLAAGGTGIVGTVFELSQITPATSGFFSITGRSFVGSPFDNAASGTPDSTVLNPPSNLLDPTNDDNLGRSTTGLAPTPPAANTLAANLTLTASATTPLGVYTFNEAPIVSSATDDAANDYSMSTGIAYSITVGQTLTVTKNGTGFGTVTADSGAINCGVPPACSDIYPGTVVTLTATPNAGSTFTAWSGACSGTGTCVVTVNAATTVTATFTVIAAILPPTISKAFGTGNIVVGGSTSLTFNIANPNVSALTGIIFTDTLPAGLKVSTPNGFAGSCGAGTITATAGLNSISLGGGTLAGSGSCSFSVNVTGTTAGTKNNVTGAITSAESGAGGTASASVTVAGVAAPTIAKSFAPTSVTVGGASTLSFTVTNPNASTAFTVVGFTDTLPAGVVVSTPIVLTGSCGGGTIIPVLGSISLSGAALPASGSCTFSVSVTANTSGTKVNTTGTVSSAEGGIGGTATATLTVAGIAAPTIAKSFGSSSIAPAGTTTLSFTINNTNAGTTLTHIGFTDTLPAGLVVSTPNGLTGACGGGTITATAGLPVSLTGASLAANASCVFTVNVTATSNGTKVNVTSAVTSMEGGAGNAATASVTVGIAAPIPTLQQWALWMLSLLILVVTGATMYSRRKN